MGEVLTLDCVVIGGGVVGLAIAREMAIAGREVVLLEAEPMTGSITSSRNSEVIHAGLYYPGGSLKAELCVAGKEKLYDYCRDRHIPHMRCGKLVVASNEAEVAYLEKLLKQAQANGVDDCRLIDGAELARLEPQITGFAALVSPSTGIIDSHRLMEAYIADIEAHGGSVVLNSPVLGGEFLAGAVRLSVGGRDPVEIEAKLVVNSAGLSAWAISEGMIGLDRRTIPERHYAKGCYFSLTGRAPTERLIYPVPETGGLGIHLTFDLAGQARFGPDVEWVEAIDYDVDPRRADKFYGAIRRYWPNLPDGALQPAYSGMRPKVVGPNGGGAGDFIIQGPETTGHPAYTALYGIESPGLTASLAVAERVARLTSR
ncbi:NAD(P)/FAD-dependent oxidoreductase [Neorhizobium sp. BETTINA12A]|uniref:NAD(P)/FAD-dependent oxidoreductase n=1 Tax=Neorhizobium sp. BETTINA12A TaxID=2908924 RepID=UPI001FF0FE40|nr:NAD(P)/FAD-dependent oxidoreductase [Neorhizobium sp. BETTINA12A]MCJ9751476.1 NAD(P)/FAD-dependent oxidoreductase [Neorhizobium sp. BETTINA12A]